jgi:uncharacterized protein (TIGR02588 family)
MSERGQAQSGNEGSDRPRSRDREGQGNGSSSVSSNGDETQQTSLWEWAAAALSTVVVLGAIGFMLNEAFTVPSSPPMITVRVDTIVAAGSGYVVEFRAQNSGQTTAAGLTIEGELRSDTGTVEKSNVTIDYVPAGSHRRGGLLFTHDPARYTLQIQPKGYDRP